MRLNRGNVRMIVKPKISVAGTVGAFYILILATTCETENIISISKTSTERLSNLLKVTQLANDGDGIWIQFLRLKHWVTLVNALPLSMILIISNIYWEFIVHQHCTRPPPTSDQGGFLLEEQVKAPLHIDTTGRTRLEARAAPLQKQDIHRKGRDCRDQGREISLFWVVPSGYCGGSVSPG